MNKKNNKILKQKISKIFIKSGVFLFLTIMALVIIIPFYWMINTSLKTSNEAQLEVPTLFPREWTFDNYKVAILGKKRTEVDSIKRKINNIEKVLLPKLTNEINNKNAEYLLKKQQAQNIENHGNIYIPEYQSLISNPIYIKYETLGQETLVLNQYIIDNREQYVIKKQIVEQGPGTPGFAEAQTFVNEYETKQAELQSKKQEKINITPQYEIINKRKLELEKNNSHYTSEYYEVYKFVIAYENLINEKLLMENELNNILPGLLKKAEAGDNDSFALYLGNTLFVGIASTILGTFLSIIGAFALSRLNFRGKELLFSIMMATMMIPGEMMVIANYITVSKLKWVGDNSFFGAPYLAMTIPFLVTIFHIYLLRQNFKQIPNELYYAAKIDGTSDWKYLWKIMVPLAKSSIITITILKLMGTWNAYIWPNLVSGQKYRLITVWLRTSFNDTQTGRVLVEQQMAATVVVLIPLLFVFIFLRKYIMRGVSRGGIKG